MANIEKRIDKLEEGAKDRLFVIKIAHTVRGDDGRDYEIPLIRTDYPDVTGATGIRIVRARPEIVAKRMTELAAALAAKGVRLLCAADHESAVRKDDSLEK